MKQSLLLLLSGGLERRGGRHAVPVRVNAARVEEEKVAHREAALCGHPKEPRHKAAAIARETHLCGMPLARTHRGSARRARDRRRDC